MALPAGFVLDKPEKVKLPSGFVLDSDKAGLASLAKPEPREAPVYDPLGQVIGDIPAPLDYQVEGQGRMNEPGAFTTIADLAKQFIAPGAKAPFALPLATETAAKGFVRQAMEQPESSLTSAVQPGLVRFLSPLLMQQKEAVFGPKTEQDRLKKQLEIQRTIASIPSIPGAKTLNKIGENVQKDILGSLSPEAKKALAESQITGNIFEGEVDFGTNPNAYGYALQAANVFGSMAPVIATAMVTKSPGAGGFVGGTMAADEAATKAADFINKIPDAELRQKSPIYAELIAAGASPKEARELTIKKAAESGAALQGLVATFGDVVTGKLVTGAFNNTIAKLGTNRLVRAGGVGAASSLEESLQEVGEGLASDITLKNVIPSKELGEDSAANLILGALGGAGPGVVKGALSEGEPKAPEREKYVQPEGGLAELMARQKGFLTPEGRPPAPPAAPTAQAPVPPTPPAGPAETIQAPGSEALDTQAMLEELINSVNYPQEKAPEVVAEKPVEAPAVKAPVVEAPEEQAPPTVKIYRGHRIGEEFKSADDGNLGAGFYTTESEQAAKEFASRNKDGTVLQGELNAKRILDMDKLSKEDIANLKRAIPKTAQELQEYGIPYYDDATNELVTEDLQKIHSNLNRGGFEPRKLSDALPQGYTDALGAIYNEAGYDAITRTGDALKSGTKYKEYVTFSPESQKLLTPKAPTTTPETREEYPTLSKTEVEELGLAPKPKVQKPAEPKIDYLNHPDNVGSDASSKREFDNKGKLQVAPQNIADGGTPFKSRAAADVARKNYPDMRVLPTADKKGFILAPKTPKQIEADKAKAKRLGLPMTTTKGTPMAAHQFITSEGGITKDAMKDLGMDENVRSGNRSLFTDTGMSVEQAYMKLQEAGYLDEGATQNDARNLITESVKKPKYRQQDTEEMTKRAQQADYEDYLKAEEEASLYSPVDEEMGYEMGDFDGTGYESASPEVQAEVRALLAQADALGINTESIKEEIFYETENQSVQAYYKAFKSALEDAITASRQDRIEDTGQPGGEGAGFELTAPTADEIRAKQAETERRAKEEERANKAAEDKARADEQAAEFTLTGSDRAADVAAARGQRDIFAEAPAETSKVQTEQERTVSIPKKEFREDKETRGKSDHPALKMVFKGETPKSLIAKYGEKDVRFLGRLFDIDVKDKFNVAKKLIAIDSGLSLIRGKDKAYFDKMNKAQLGEFLEAVGQSAYGQKYQLVERLLKHEGNVMGKFNDNLQDLKHRAAVLNEARAGKPISEEVLKDYPDVAAYSLPRDSEGYKAAIRTLAVRALPTLGMDTPATIAAYREDAKTTKDPLEKNVANDIADYMESYYKSQQEKSNQTMAKLGSGTGPTMSEMIAENKRVKAELAALEKAEKGPLTEAEKEAAAEAEEEEIRNKAEAEIDEGPIGQAIAKIENGDIETKAQIRSLIVKLERDGTLDDVEDVREGLSDREQDASEVLDTLSGLLDDARDNAIDERFDELLEESAQEEAVVEPAEEPSFEVETPEGNTLTYPAAFGLVNTGYTVLALNDPRTYTDKGGKQHRTFEKDGARIAVSPSQVLFEFKGRVQYGMGNPNELTLEMLAVDPKDRGKGKGTQVLKDLTKVADQYGITLYGEPTPIVNLKQNDVGLDFDQLVNLYKKFDFKFQELDSGVSERVIVREPEVEVLPAEEPQIAGQVGFEPYTIEGDFTEVAEEQQRLMLEDQTENLSDDQVSTLEKHYGATIDSDEFFTKLREDVTNFIVKGATAVNGKIRAIIRQLANGVLAVGIAFNPQYMSQPINVFMPVDNVRTEEVLAQVPDAATDKMSEPAKRAFAVIYPALQEQMVAKDKLFIMADKPSGRVFVFNPDGSLLLEKKSLFGLAKGDLYVGDNDKPQNRITPAGLFDLKFVDAAKGAAEKRTAGDYDTGTVLAINDPDGTITIMHSVWLKEKDAAQRAAALRNDSPADSRYSFGCINVDAPTYKFLVDNHAQQMDGAALFIVPEAGVDVMSFITGKGAMSEDLARIKIKPVTKEVRTPQRQATQAEAKTKTPGREQQFFSLEKQTGTPAFKKWFGDSKVVDANGNPLIVYHGTNEDFDTFDPYAEKKTQGGERLRGTNAIFFSSNPELASAYAGVAKSTLTGQSFAYPAESAYGGNVMPVYLSMQNPMIVDAEGQMYTKVEPLIREAKKKGYDGVIFKNVADQPGAAGSLQVTTHDAYVVFKKEQIKSATGNRGTFDESGNINMSLEDDMVRLVNQIADSIAENEKKRSPSFKRTAKTLTRQRGEGKLTDEEYLEGMNAAIEEDEENRLNKDVPERVRGADYIRQKLLEAKRRKMITAEGVSLAEWFIQQNPALVDDLGISVVGKGLAGVGGFYNSDARIINLIKDAGSSQTATHEILHHLERMMPTDIQNAIRKAWLTQLLKANKAAKDPAQRLYFMALLDAHIGNNNHDRLEIPKDLEKIYKSAVKQMQFASALAGDPFGSSKSSDLAKNLLLYSPTVTNDLYEYFDPSEFWAVNGSDIVQARYEAVKGGVLAKLKNWLREFTQKIKSLLGLKSDASIIRALDSLAKSDGKFVTRKMLGTGEYRSIERRNYEGGEAPEPDMEIPEMSFMDDVIYKYGDKLIDTKRLIQSIQSTGRKIDERFDAYMKEENYHGRLAKRTKNFLNEEMRPVLEDMQEKNVTLDELETFLLNRHAKEANAYIAKINPVGFPEAGSSVSDEAADKYMAELTPEKRKDLMALAAKVDAIVKETQRVLVANGLETQDTIDEWNKTYKNYVPLQRDNLDFVHTGRGVMGGFGTRGSASKRRVGSDKPVIDIFANIAMQRERALRRSEQARVGRALYGMAIKHPNPGFWLAINPDAIKDKDKLEAELISLGLTPEDARSIIQEPRQPMFDKKTGQVKYQVNPLLRDSPNVFPIRINGEDRFIFFNPNDPRALRMVESIRNLDTERLGDAIGMASMVTRWFASVNTQYNIVFGAVNFLRDLSAASLNLSTTEIAGKEKKVRANVLPALRAIYRDLRGKGATTEAMAEMQDWFERFQMAGGQTGYQNQFAETKRKGNVVEQELRRLNRGNVKKSVDAVFDWLSDYNDAIENSIRLSAFKVAVESGLSEDKAASIAKNLTVNFNRKGARTGFISALYAFFNAAVQGSTRMVETLRGPMGKKIIFGGMLLGSMQAIALAMAGFDDDEPPEFVKDKNLIIPIPFTDKKYLSIPMPLGFNMFPGFGRLAMETLLIETGMIRSRKGPGDKVMSAVSLVFDAFNPLGGSGNPLLMAVPTIGDPFAAIYSNKDSFGRPIYKEDRGTAPTPGYERSRENASIVSKKLAEAINYVTSPAGTKHTKGFFSPTADEIDYFIGQITGGVGREIMKVGEFAKSKAVTQEEVPAYKLPVVGRFYGEAESPAATRSRFYENVTVMAKHEYEIKGLRKDRISPAEYVKANPEARLWQRANNVENQIVKLNKEKKALIERDAPREAVKRKEDEILNKMKQFNDQVRRGQ